MEVRKVTEPFHHEGHLRRRERHEGPLLKFTNLLKGYQLRWFVLNTENGILEYHERETTKHGKPRGYVNLTYSKTNPSDEVPFGITISTLRGVVLKLKAADSKERELWIKKLNLVAESFTDIAIQNLKNTQSDARGDISSFDAAQDALFNCESSTSSIGDQLDSFHSNSADSPISKSQELIRSLESQYQSLVKSINNIQTNGNPNMELLEKLFLCKATAQASVLHLDGLVASLPNLQKNMAQAASHRDHPDANNWHSAVSSQLSFTIGSEANESLKQLTRSNSSVECQKAPVPSESSASVFPTNENISSNV